MADGIKPKDFSSKYISFFNEKIMCTHQEFTQKRDLISEQMRFSKNKRTERFDIKVEGDYLEEASQTELLGMIFESNMRFKA